MSENTDQANLWKIIVQYGLEQEYERDWLGRIKSKRTKHYLKAEITPELAQLLADTSAQVGGVVGVAKASLSATHEHARKLLAGRETKDSV